MISIYSFAEHFPYLGLFSLLVLGGLGLPFPEDATLILCGFLIAHDVVKSVPAIVVVFAGLVLADFLIFSVGRKYGRTILNHRRFRKIISPGRLSLLEDKFRKRGGLVILLGRHFFGLRAQLFLVAGISRVPSIKFLLFDALSSVITMAIFIGIGFAGGNSFQIIKKDISRIEHLALFLSVVLLFVYLYIRNLRERHRIKQEETVKPR